MTPGHAAPEPGLTCFAHDGTGGMMRDKRSAIMAGRQRRRPAAGAGRGGAGRLLEPLHLDRRHRALVTILGHEPSEVHETAFLSEASLAEDWNRPGEDAAWSHLQQVQ